MSSPGTVRLLRNPSASRASYPVELQDTLSLDAHHDARRLVEHLPGYQHTALQELPNTADQLGIGKLWLKDEGTRFGLGAFKAIGGAYAVYRQLCDRIRTVDSLADLSPQNLLNGAPRDITSRITIACASAGNHGRAVAWGARLFGAQCIVYLYEGVSAARRAAIEALGAVTDWSAPSYDEAVRRVARDAERHGWVIVSDTAYPGYMDIPRDVMQGYTVIAQEALEQLAGERPTHVLLQVGVGGFAAAIAAHLWESLGERRPRFIAVEPSGAACLLESIALGRPTSLPAVSSISGGLCCGEVSLLAWDVLYSALDWCVAVPDESIMQAMRALAQPPGSDPRIVAGESGAPGFAALAALCANAEMKQQLGLDGNARVLLFSTEGVLDPATWADHTGRTLGTGDAAGPVSGTHAAAGPAPGTGAAADQTPDADNNAERHAAELPL